MRIRVAVENGNDGRSLAWALDFPGCFAYGKDESEAIISLPRAYLQYRNWIEQHAPGAQFQGGSLDIQLVEVWQCYFIDDDYQVKDKGVEVNAWFRDDWRRLSREEVECALQLLQWSRSDLLEVIATLTPADLSRHLHHADRWPVSRVLQHIANAEWWYLDRLGLAPWRKEDLPEDASGRLAFIRDQVNSVVRSLVNLDMTVGKDGEFWSPRKLVRRLLYHERDHLGHILQILAEPH